MHYSKIQYREVKYDTNMFIEMYTTVYIIKLLFTWCMLTKYNIK